MRVKPPGPAGWAAGPEAVAAVLDAKRPAPRDRCGDDPDDFFGEPSEKPPVPIVEDLDSYGPDSYDP
ncbi:hypothetical protein HCN51_16190 [Nonomuraea sp. FMUSA5-5]|uniref:Uncharacterized protein n=1 Tax=Nonomuraea composti TaxID=2720023 RepID=A0ABX1B347_9ACTN|nr:hypothetical protein [Nonomuraea sp. FMUSA5-5]NJP90980.1 hypothetical protein [Nonomuraea sp. FMUSA5-5]